MARIELPYTYDVKIEDLYDAQSEQSNNINMSRMSWLDLLTLSDQDKTDIVFPKQPQIETSPVEYDYVILFGGVSQEERTNCAARLFEEGRVKKIIPTGGIGFLNSDRMTTEAEKMRRQLKTLGIQDSDIIMELSSRSTIENIDNSIFLLEKVLGCNLDRQIIGFLSSWFHITRIAGLIQQKMTPGNPCLKNFYGIGALDGINDPDNWFQNSKGKITINKELYLLYVAAKKGIIPDLIIPPPKIHAKKRY